MWGQCPHWHRLDGAGTSCTRPHLALLTCSCDSRNRALQVQPPPGTRGCGSGPCPSASCPSSDCRLSRHVPDCEGTFWVCPFRLGRKELRPRAWPGQQPTRAPALRPRPLPSGRSPTVVGEGPTSPPGHHCLLCPDPCGLAPCLFRPSATGTPSCPPALTMSGK